MFAQKPVASEASAAASVARAVVARMSAPPDSSPVASHFAHDFSLLPVYPASAKTKTLLQRQTVGTANVTSAPPTAHEVLRSSGQPLDEKTRAFLEPRFGHNFGHVRVHADSRAAQSAQAVGASAYTVGRDIIFAPGQFAPHTISGQRLLAHELAHTIQQSGGASAGDKLRVSPQNDPFERDAERVSSSVMSISAAIPQRKPVAESSRSSGLALQRQPKGADHDPEMPKMESTVKKKEEFIPVFVCSSSSDAKIPCTPVALPNPDFLAKGGPSDALGFTRPLPEKSRAPEILTQEIGKGHAVILKPTKAVQISCESFITKAGKPFMRSTALDENHPNFDQCGGKFDRSFVVTPDGEKRLREAEMEHCKDFKYAYDVSLGCYESVINEFAKKKTQFPSAEEADDAVVNRVGQKPDMWMPHYADLLEKTKIRDTSKWHEPPAREGWTSLKVIGKHCSTEETTPIDAKSFPQVGRHAARDFIK
ncbi:MAG: DUF4157 domain-containing protein [Candidatus Sulfotelmatobacter sp.]